MIGQAFASDLSAMISESESGDRLARRRLKKCLPTVRSAVNRLCRAVVDPKTQKVLGYGPMGVPPNATLIILAIESEASVVSMARTAMPELMEDINRIPKSDAQAGRFWQQVFTSMTAGDYKAALIFALGRLNAEQRENVMVECQERRARGLQPVIVVLSYYNEQSNEACGAMFVSDLPQSVELQLQAVQGAA